MEGSCSGIAFSSSDSSGRFPTSSSPSSGGRSKVEKQSPKWRFRMEGSFSGIALSSSDSSGRFPTSSIRSSGGRSNVGKAIPEIAFSHGRKLFGDCFFK